MSQTPTAPTAPAPWEVETDIIGPTRPGGPTFSQEKPILPQEKPIPGTIKVGNTTVMPLFENHARFALARAAQGIQEIDDRLEFNDDIYEVPKCLRAVKAVAIGGKEVPVVYVRLGYKEYQAHPWAAITEPVTRNRPEFANLPDLVFSAEGVAVIGDWLIAFMPEATYKAIRERELEIGRQRMGRMQQRGPDGQPWTGDQPITGADQVGINVKPMYGTLPDRKPD